MIDRNAFICIAFLIDFFHVDFNCTKHLTFIKSVSGWGRGCVHQQHFKSFWVDHKNPLNKALPFKKWLKSLISLQFSLAFMMAVKRKSSHTTQCGLLGSWRNTPCNCIIYNKKLILIIYKAFRPPLPPLGTHLDPPGSQKTTGKKSIKVQTASVRDQTRDLPRGTSAR